MSATKFAEFLKAKKLDARRILNASHKLETLTHEDRTIRQARRQAKKSGGEGAAAAPEGGDKAAAAPKESRKTRSGRPVTQRALDAALVGGALSGPTKTRILRAINYLLEQKKADKVELRALFGK